MYISGNKYRFCRYANTKIPLRDFIRRGMAFLAVLCGLQSLCQLIGAGGLLHAAGDALDAGDDVIDVHAFDQSGNTLQVAVAAADELNILDLVILDLEEDALRADAGSLVFVLHNSISFLFMGRSLHLDQIYKFCGHEPGQFLRIQEHLMAPSTGGDGDLVIQLGGLVHEGGIFLFHTHRAAAAPDVSGQAEKLLHGDHRHILVARCLGCLLQIQLKAHRNAEHIDARPLATGHQGLEDLLRRLADGFGGVIAVKVIFVKLVKFLPAGDARLLNQTDRVGFCCHNRSPFHIIRYFFSRCKSELFRIGGEC